MIRLLAALLLLAAPALGQQRAIVVPPGDAVVIAPRGAVQPAPALPGITARPRLAPQGPVPATGRGVAEWVTSPWVIAPLVAAGALAVLLPGGSGGSGAPASGGGLAAGSATVAR